MLRTPPRSAHVIVAFLLSALVIVSACAPAPSRRGAVETNSSGPWPALSIDPMPTPTHRAVPYGTGARQVADVYLPAGEVRGTLIAVHGGWFVSGARSEVSRYFGPIMAQVARGYAVVAIDYTLASTVSGVYPAAIRDIAAVVRWVAESGSDVGLNTDDIVLVGHSAGGTLATLTAFAANSGVSATWGIDKAVDGVISYAGIYDLTSASVGPETARWFGSVTDESVRTDASPVNHIDADDPPVLLIHGASDLIVPISQMYALVDQAHANGVNSIRHESTVSMHVDRTSGTAIGCNGHVPFCGSNQSFLDDWLDSIVD